LPAPIINGGGDSLWKWPNFRLSGARDLDLDLGSGHIAYRHASLIYLYLRTKCHWNRRNFLWTDGRTYRRAAGHLRPTLLGRFVEVDLLSKQAILGKLMIHFTITKDFRLANIPLCLTGLVFSALNQSLWMNAAGWVKTILQIPQMWQQTPKMYYPHHSIVLQATMSLRSISAWPLVISHAPCRPLSLRPRLQPVWNVVRPLPPPASAPDPRPTVHVSHARGQIHRWIIIYRWENRTVQQ